MTVIVRPNLLWWKQNIFYAHTRIAVLAGILFLLDLNLIWFPSFEPTFFHECSNKLQNKKTGEAERKCILSPWPFPVPHLEANPNYATQCVRWGVCAVAFLASYLNRAAHSSSRFPHGSGHRRYSSGLFTPRVAFGNFSSMLSWEPDPRLPQLWLGWKQAGLKSLAKFIMFPLISAELPAQNWDPVLQSWAEHGRGNVQQRNRRAGLRGVPGPPRPESAAEGLQQVPCTAGQ